MDSSSQSVIIALMIFLDRNVLLCSLGRDGQAEFPSLTWRDKVDFQHGAKLIALTNPGLKATFLLILSLAATFVTD